jgi:hypothetical protein
MPRVLDIARGLVFETDEAGAEALLEYRDEAGKPLHALVDDALEARLAKAAERGFPMNLVALEAAEAAERKAKTKAKTTASTAE